MSRFVYDRINTHINTFYWYIHRSENAKQIIIHKGMAWKAGLFKSQKRQFESAAFATCFGITCFHKFRF